MSIIVRTSDRHVSWLLWELPPSTFFFFPFEGSAELQCLCSGWTIAEELVLRDAVCLSCNSFLSAVYLASLPTPMFLCVIVTHKLLKPCSIPF